MSTSVTKWTAQDSATLTAWLVVHDRMRMSGDRLDVSELLAICDLAINHKVPRQVIADRIGWSSDRLRKWCSAHGIAWNGGTKWDLPKGY